MKTEEVLPHLNVFWFSKGNPTGHKNKRKAEEEVERQY